MLSRASRGRFLAPLPVAAILCAWSCALASGTPPPAALPPRAAPPAPGAPPAAAPARVAATDAARADDVPSLQPGMWEYQRLRSSPGEGAARTPGRTSKCSDPSREMRANIAELKKKGCRFSPLEHDGNTYRRSWVCPAQEGAVAISQVLTVSGDSSYEDVSEARFEEQRTHTKIIANRVGECPLLPGAAKHSRRPPPVAAPAPVAPVAPQEH